MKRLMALGALSLALAATAPASASIVTLTFTGVANNLGYGYPWGYDAFGTNIVGDPYVATLRFDLSQGTTMYFGGEQYFTASGGYSGSFTIAGHTYDATGSTAAVYLRTSNAVEAIIYDDPKANTGLVLYAPLTNTATISPDLASPVGPLTLDPADVVVSGFDVVLPLDGGALYAGENVNTLTIAAVPEAGAWILMLVGFGLAGAGLRANRRRALAA